MVSVQIDCTECLARTCEVACTLAQSPEPSCLHARYASEILALVEVLASALLADNCLVTRYEPGKELSVSVCHNSEFDWLK